MTERGLEDRAAHALRYFFLRRLPTCRQTVELISQSLERPLTLRERVATRIHLWVCIWCVRYLEQLQLMRDTLGARSKQVSDDASPDGDSLSAQARERMKRALGQHSR
ncbi:MAG TPA: hypothetical protein VFA21_10815 [Pyrinomonadaceae bacterium]|jgi:hypothetical protein|nr:hypothetical protein [Pyrinomonadaceae bacterium]